MDAHVRPARRWLRLDAGYCVVAGLMAIALSAPLSRLFHVPLGLLVAVGVATLVWALLLVMVSRAERVQRSVALVAAANAVASAGLVGLAAVAPALAAQLLLLAVAIEVAAFAAVQVRLLRRWVRPL